jgi:hypothetical protein
MVSCRWIAPHFLPWPVMSLTNDCEDDCLLECCTVQSCTTWLAFQVFTAFVIRPTISHFPDVYKGLPASYPQTFSLKVVTAVFAETIKHF